MTDKFKTINDFSFWPGWNQLRKCDEKDARRDVMGALNITSEIAFMKRRRGEVEPKMSEMNALRKVFKKYGVTKNIWGYEWSDKNAD